MMRARQQTEARADEVLALLRCPETQQTLTRAAPDLVTHLEVLRAAGRLRDLTPVPPGWMAHALARTTDLRSRAL